jgi:excisionase family DNA binding protein
MIQIDEITAYDVQEMAKKLKLSPDTIRTYCKTEKFRAQKVGQRWYVASNTLQEWLKGETGE